MRLRHYLLIVLILLVPACGPATSMQPGQAPSTQVGQLGHPLENNGVALTALRVFPKDQRANGTRGLYVEVAIENQDRPTLTLEPAAFQLVDTTGASYPAEFITYDQLPPDELVLDQDQRVLAHVNFSIPGTATEQTLHYNAFSGAERMELALTPPVEPTIAISNLNLEQSKLAEVPPPAGWTRIGETTTVLKHGPGFGLPKPEAAVGLFLAPPDGTTGAGQISVLGYASLQKPLYLYNLVRYRSDSPQDIDGVGERAVLIETKPQVEGAPTIRQFNFSRCQAHVMLQFAGLDSSVLPNAEDLSAYGQRLDAALQAHVCP